MNRKNFLLTAAGGGALRKAAFTAGPADEEAPCIPPYLSAGDTVGIVAPAGYITEADVAPAAEMLMSWGWKVRLGASVGGRYHSFAGSDADRLADFQHMLDDDEVKAILCARGGYGMIRIIDELDFKKFCGRPKWIAGFSDITVLHCHLNRNFGIPSIHSKMCNSFPSDWTRADPLQQTTIMSIKSALAGEPMHYTIPVSECNISGTTEGILVGGNLKTIETLGGTGSDLHTDGKILFVEDTGEYLYSIDRMFWNLERTGKLQRLKGLIVGGFRVKPDDPGEEFGEVLEDIVLGRVRRYGFPVCFNFPVGHQKNNFALKCGMPHRLTVSTGSCTLQEIR